MKITDKVKSFEDACAVLGVETKLPDVSGLVEKHQKAIIAFYKLSVIVQVLNEGWEPNWEDWSENKYFNYLLVGGNANDGAFAGFVLSNSYSSPSGAAAAVGSRLCFKSRELAIYARGQFIELYRDYLLFT